MQHGYRLFSFSGRAAFFACGAMALGLFLLTGGVSHGAQSIVALVNDEPISAFDVKQRTKLKMASDSRVSKILRKKLKSKSTPERFKKFVMKAKPQSKAEVEKLKGRFVKMLRDEVVRSLRSGYKKEVLDELIGERLMIQEAKKLNLVVSDSEVTDHLKKMASRSKNRKTGKPLSVKEFVGQLTRAGVREKDFRQRIKASLSLQKIVYRKYGRQINVGQAQVDRAIATGGAGDVKKTTEFQLQKVTFTIPSLQDQGALAKRLLEADQFRSRFTSCANTAALVKTVSNASLQALGKRNENQISEPTRSIVLKTNVGQMTPPLVNQGAVELYAVCSRRVVLADEKQRRNVQAKLRSQELTKLRERYMRDLRQDAFIEYR